MTLIKYTLLAMMCFIGSSTFMSAHAMTTKAKQAIVVDYETGQVLFEKSADEKMPTSSMSKTMTAYAVFDAIKKGKITENDSFLVSKKAWKKGGSKMFVEVDKYVTVKDLLRGVIVQSGNDATIVLAEGLAGQEDYFAEAITGLAHSIGMTNSNFKNASGWPDPNHYSTARDLATLSMHLIKDFPDYYSIFSEKEFTYSSIKQRNRNPLLYRNIGADGIKTGHTEIGGYGLMGSGVHNDRRVIVVVNGLKTEKDRAQESARLLEWGLRRFEYKTLFESDEVIGTPKVTFGKEKMAEAIAGEDLTLAMPIVGMHNVKIEKNFDDNLVAPIQQGDKIGTLTVTIPEQKVMTFPLVAKTTIEQKGFIGRTIEKIPSLLNFQVKK